MNIPLVTCVIPVHNHENWVKDAILSITLSNSDYPNKRLVIVDDGSSDNSLQVILSLLEQKNLVQHNENLDEEPKAIYTGVIHGVLTIVASFHTPKGPSVARNYGIKTGWEGTDLFAFLDSDDIYLPGKISKSVKIWQEWPDLIGIVYSDYTTYNPYTGAKQRQYKEPYSRQRLMQECIINNDSIYSKKALEKVGLYDENLRCVEDFDLHLRTTEYFSAVHIPENLITIRVGSHSSTDNVKKQTWEDCYRRVMQKLQQRLNAQT